MLNFLIGLLAYPNVRTEPQSDIGRNRGKKICLLSWLIAFLTRGKKVTARICPSP